MNTTSERRAGNAGFTLIEVVVAMAILSIVMIGILNLFSTNAKAHVSQELTLELTQDLRAVLNLMSTEIRMAGYDPQNSGNFGFIDDTGPKSIRFTMDLGDGAGGNPNSSVDSGEDVNYYVDANGNLLRIINGAAPSIPADVAAENISNLTFTFLDANNNITWILADIRTVRISITGETRAIDPMLKRVKTRTETAQIKVRNLGLSS